MSPTSGKPPGDPADRDVREIQFDGLVGPTHHFGGLSYGNPASMAHRGEPSNPRRAAMQGLRKMKRLMDRGILQALLPPLERPHLRTLRRLGFEGSDEDILRRAASEAPGLLSACSSAAAMWAANRLTVSPSPDTRDGRVHLTPANRVHHLHRAIESGDDHRLFRRLFGEDDRFRVHRPLPASNTLADEGAANHLRLAPSHPDPGVEVFVYARASRSRDQPEVPYPSRQTLEGSRAVARLHRLDPDRVVALRQAPEVIQLGGFHNDLVSVANERFLLYHEAAFQGGEEALEPLRDRFREVCGRPLREYRVSSDQLPLREALESYVFNSQVVTLPEGGMLLLAPERCRRNEATNQLIQDLIERDTPVREVEYVDLGQSMRNGGGPACMRVRLTMTQAERRALPEGLFLNEERYERLLTWVQTHFREKLSVGDLGNPSVLRESREALDELTGILGLPPLYPFQRGD